MTDGANRDSAGELARVLGHELGEIAALLDGYIDEDEDWASLDARGSLRRTTQRLRIVYEGLNEFAAVASAEQTPAAVDPAWAVATARERLRERAEATADLDIGPLPTVIGDPAQLEQLFTHLLRSATSKASSGRRVIVTGSSEGPDVQLDFDAAPLGDRLPTAAHARPLVGHGVDLAVATRIAERNGGHLRVTGNDRSGTTISLTLPAAEP